MPRIQANRRAAFITPLGEEALLLKTFTGTEELGRLFNFELELLSEQRAIKFEDIVGQNATVRLALPGGGTRYFNGFISRFAQLPNQDTMASYRATLSPWLWFLTRMADCRIFQDKTVPKIVEDVFRDHGFTDFKNSLSGSYRERDYCVQYRETDFNFISRLLEEEGIYYFFEHDNGKHTLVLADSKSAHATYEGYSSLPYLAQKAATPHQQVVTDWLVEQAVLPDFASLNDFDFEKPNTSLNVKAGTGNPHAASGFEVFDYPGGYKEYADGETNARLRIEEIQAGFEVAKGTTQAHGVVPGCLLSLERHPRDDQNREYLIVGAQYQLKLDFYGSAVRAEEAEFFQCQFSAVPSEKPFRAARQARKPVLGGPQTAIVTGPSGEEIYTDKYGRVKVQFHWDRRGKGDENSSCWLRVGQSWAGKNWGAIQIPRIGHEVIVSFLEGDPDQPLIIGSVYNAESMPPYALPDNKTLSTLKSNSSKNGKGFNEIRFEDKKGDEQIFIHAEKNQDIRVKNSVYETVGANRHLIVGNDQVEQVLQDRHETVKRDHAEKIGRDRSLLVAGKEAKEIAASQSLKVKGDVIEEFSANHSEKTAADYYLKADNIVIEALTNVTIKVGESFIAIEAGGIKIGTNGKIVLDSKDTMNLKSMGAMSLESIMEYSAKGLKVALKADTELAAQGLKVSIAADTMAELKGNAMAKIQGAMVMIN